MKSDQGVRICRNCKEKIILKEIYQWWDENGYGYSTKLCECPICRNVNVIEYNEDPSLDINKDTRWF